MINVWFVVVALVAQFSTASADEFNCTTIFVITRSTTTRGSIARQIGRQRSDSLSDCLQTCRQKNECSHAAFHFSGDANATTCTLYAGGVEASLTSPIIYTAEKMCVQTSLLSQRCASPWTYELFERTTVVGDRQHFVLADMSNTALDVCLSRCNGYGSTENGVDVTCRSALYDSGSGRCRLLAIAPNSVRNVNDYFQPAAATALYERNCADGEGLTIHSRLQVLQCHSPIVNVISFHCTAPA